MMRCSLLLAGLLLWPGPALAFGEAGGSSCVVCHRGLDQASVAGRAVVDWQGSRHAQEGVTCDRCHGGDATAPDREAAHAGLRPRDDPASPIHPARVPATCGACHRPQYEEFAHSDHYRALVSGQGAIAPPTCVTCHGAMHTAVLAPDTVAAACRGCHNRRSGIAPGVPATAHATLDLIFFAKTTLLWSHEAVARARAAGHPVAEVEAELAVADGLFQQAAAQWHSFRFEEIVETIEGAYARAKAVKGEVDRLVAEGVVGRLGHGKVEAPDGTP